MSSIFARSFLALLLMGLSPQVLATELADGKLSVNGNGEWAYARTAANAYLLADSDGDYANALFDLVVTARPDDNLVIAADLGFDPDEVELHWAFAEWRFSDAVRARVGKVKQPLGNYMELEGIGTARPFFTLPTSVYGPTTIGATAYLGAGLTGELPLRPGWTLAYDLYGGALELPISEPYQALVGGEPFVGTTISENVVGGRLSLQTPGDVTLRLSGFGGHSQAEEDGGGLVEEEKSDFFTSGASVLYRGERLWVSAEGFASMHSGDETQVGAYAEVAWFLTDRWQLAGRYELGRVFLDDFDGTSPLLRHDEVAVGVNYWFSRQLALKASVHGVDGTRFTSPEDGALAADGRTVLVVAGAQFAF